MLTEELADDSVVVKATLDLVLDVRVLDLLVVFDHGFDLVNHALKRPFGQIGRHLHVLLLNVDFSELDFLEEVRHLTESGASLGETIQDFLRELTVDFVLLENSDFLDLWSSLGQDSFDECVDFLLLQVAT